MEKIFIVIPTIRNLDFLESWKKQFTNANIIVCEDKPTKTIKIPKVGKKIYHYSWQEIDDDLGKNSWIIPRKVSAIRNYGFLKAHQMGANAIITIDDDCYPVKNHHLIDLHTKNLSLKTPQNWVNTYPDARYMYTRGMPYLNRDEATIMVSHGLWTNVLDLDGPTHLQNLNFKAEFAQHFLQIIPKGAYYPMCSMNLAFRREVTPLMYFPLMGEDKNGNKWGYDRFDDIWAGIFSKKIMDHLGYGVINGAPFVEHRKASDPFKNLIKEATGIEVNEKIWFEVDKVKLTSNNVIDSYRELIEKVDFPKTDYFVNLKKAILLWIELF
ncbi:hypothetical protein KKE34_00410 [Patescibacteria group bacterium]|nr:hypothetical protein [Patescibacteria group bacterium]MBU1885057.1 hypothetical protein [Patescibacteria group bacterium]